jgi:hypothetical protein
MVSGRAYFSPAVSFVAAKKEARVGNEPGLFG